MKVKNARVCADCDNIFGKNHFTCPQCGSTSWFYLSRFVPSLENDEAEVRHTYQPDHGPGPEQDRQADPPRPFFVRLWGRVTAPLRMDAEVSA